MGQNLYTLWVQGGAPFALTFPANPAVEHDGGTTVTHLVLSIEEVQHLRGMLEGYEFSLAAMEGQTSKQEEERLSLLGVGKDDTVWPSKLCPTCAWFDPTQENPCGKLGWEPSVVEAFMRKDKPQNDWERCDVKG